MKKIYTLCLATGLCLLLIGCSSRAPFTLTALEAAATTAEMQFTPIDAPDLGVAGVTDAGNLGKEGANARVVLFDTDANARALFANIVAGLQPIAGTRTNLDSATYNKLLIQGDSDFYAVLRIDNTLFFGNDQGGGEIAALLKALGY